MSFTVLLDNYIEASGAIAAQERYAAAERRKQEMQVRVPEASASRRSRRGRIPRRRDWSVTADGGAK